MSDTKRAAVILAAGQGTRMKSELPKVLHQVGGRAMLDWAIAAAQEAGCEKIIVVAGAHSPAVPAHATKRLGESAIAIQDPPLGTAHAVRAAENALKDFAGDIAVMYADAPLLRGETLRSMFDARKDGLAVLAFEAADPFGYGRIVLGEEGVAARIVEQKDATPDEQKIGLCNSGVICADKATLFQLLAQVKNENAKQEYYLTDVVGLARKAALKTYVALAPETEVLGVNSRVELAEAETAFQQRARLAAMESGVTLIDPASVYFSYDTQIAPDVVIEPNCYFGLGVKIASGAQIHASCYLEGVDIGANCNIGPFARVRPGTKLGAKVKLGNFVEIKNATFSEGAKASHLTYVGDADIGPRANLGCGTITCNYDGFDKYRTVIGEDAFIGSDTALVAPVKIGARATTAAGSVITKDVPDGALGIARGKQRDVEGWSDRFRAQKQAKQAAAKKDKKP